MLKIHAGPFHPALEEALAASLSGGARDAFTPVAVVAPSSRLRDRCQMFLAERGVAALNVHFHTLASLADEIVWAGKPPGEPLVSDPLFFDTLVKLILKKDRPFPGFADLAVPDGFPPSVRATLRDLTDAGVEPEKLLEAVKDPETFNLPEVDLGSLKQLTQLHRLYLRRIKALKVAPRSKLVEGAIEQAAGSEFLKRFSRILFYGFYDLTGLQARLFEEIARAHSSEFFFPYRHEHPDWAFAARFRSDILHKIPHEETFLLPASDEPPLLHRGVAAVERSSGPLPLRLKWDGLEARVLNVSGLRDEAWSAAGELIRLHEEEGIPYSQMAVVARLRERLVEFADVFFERGIPFVTSWKDTLASAPQIEAARRLIAAAEWPESAPWSDFAKRAGEAIEGNAGPVWDELRKAAATLRDFDRLAPSVSRAEFTDTLELRWRDWPAPAPGRGVGVALLHAEAARGLAFDVVFLAGLEERVFPRVIREDPFLRDTARFFIFETLGNKIGQKLSALEEERLLLHLILTSARSRLYVSYQRSDQDGKIVGPSSFLRRLLAEWGVAAEEAVNVVPRRLTDKLAAAEPATLALRDLISGFLMTGQRESAARLANACGRDGQGLAHALKALQSHESFVEPSGFDGILRPASGRRHIEMEGVSPSGLETFVYCPFQYFINRVLSVRPLEAEASPEEIDRRLKGELVHRMLETFYRRCGERFGERWPDAPPRDLFDAAFTEVFSVPAAGVYPLLWTMLRERIESHVWEAVMADFADLSSRGLTPLYFEQEYAVERKHPDLGLVRYEGKMDRIDVGGGRARVVDYKTGRPGKTRLDTAILRGDKAQVPLYMLLASEFLREKGRPVKEIDFSYLHVGEEGASVNMSSADWAALEKEAFETIDTELRMIAAGEFPMLPERRKCDRCEAVTVCRQADSLSAYRMETRAWDVVELRRKKGGGK